MNQELNFRQRMFLEFYLGESNGNATDAARKAGYSQPHVLGPRQLEKVEIQVAIGARCDEAALKTNEILGRLADQATGTLDDFLTMGADGEPKLDLKKARERGKLHLLKKIKRGKNGVEIELYDAQAALVHLGKYRKLFTENVNLSGTVETVVGYDVVSDPRTEHSPDPGEDHPDRDTEPGEDSV